MRTARLEPRADGLDLSLRSHYGGTLTYLQDAGCEVVEVLGAKSRLGVEQFFNTHAQRVHGETIPHRGCKLYEDFWRDPFNDEDGWYVFWHPHMPAYEVVYIGKSGMSPAVYHQTHLGALGQVAIQINKKLDCHATNSRGKMAALLYDWRPLNAAIQEARQKEPEAQPS